MREIGTFAFILGIRNGFFVMDLGRGHFLRVAFFYSTQLAGDIRYCYRTPHVTVGSCNLFRAFFSLFYSPPLLGTMGWDCCFGDGDGWYFDLKRRLAQLFW